MCRSGLSPKQRAKVFIENCAHPDFKPGLADYFRRAKEDSYGRMRRRGSMKHRPGIGSSSKPVRWRSERQNI
jgi:acyl-CoA hydrolase